MAYYYIYYNLTDYYNVSSEYYSNFSYVDIEAYEVEEALAIQFVFYSIVIPIISCIGITGNILTLIMLCKKALHPTVTIVMISLVATDIFIIILSLITMTLFSFSVKYSDLGYFYDFIYPNIFSTCNFLIMTSQQSNVWITVVIAVERYIAMCHPFISTHVRSTKNVKILIIIVFLISIIFNIPRLFSIHSKYHKIEESNKTYYTIENTEFGESNFFCYVYGIWMYAFVIYIIPILSLLVLSVPTIRQLLTMRSRIRHLSAQQTGEVNLTVCIVLVAMFFVFCQTPGIFAQIREIFSQAFTIKLLSISNTLFVFNSSVNFFIYTAAGSRFRYILKKMFLPVSKWRHRRSSKCNGSTRSFDLYRFKMMTIDLSESVT